MVPRKKDLLNEINEELRWNIVGLCYLDICNFIGNIRKIDQYKETKRTLSFSNGLMIKYAYTPSSYVSSVRLEVAILECQLLFDEKVPVLFFRSFVYEGESSLWSLRKNFAQMQNNFSLTQASLIQQILNTGVVKKTEYYQTYFHASYWMVEFLKEVFKKRKENLTKMDSIINEYTQEEIDNPENKSFTIVGKKVVREELVSVLDEFKRELISSMMQAREEVALEEKNMELVDMYIAKLGSALALSYSSNKKEKKQKKLR